MHWLFLSGILGFLYWGRSLSHDALILSWDESIYFYVAQRAAEDGLPYLNAFDHKGPLLFWALAPFVSRYAPQIEPLRILTSCLLLLSCWIVYLCARHFSRQPILALLAPLLYGAMFFQFGGLSCAGEMIMLFPACTALWFYLQAEKRPRPFLYLCQGICTALIFFIKMNGVFTVGWIPALFIWKALNGKSKEERSTYRLALFYFIAGFLICSLAVLLPYAWRGQLSLLWNDYFLYNWSYVGGSSSLHHWYRFPLFYLKVIHLSVTTALATLSVLVLAKKWKHPQGITLVGLLVGSGLGVAAPGHMHGHYFLQLALPFALLPVFALEQFPLKFARAGGLALLAFCLFATFRLFPFEPELSPAEIRGDVPQVSEYLKANSSPRDSILVWGPEPVIYYLSQRRAPFRYFFADTYRTFDSKPWLKLSASSPLFVVTNQRAKTALPGPFLALYQPEKEFGDILVLSRKR